jgi:ribA/ribD-fused uncharacterized protein
MRIVNDKLLFWRNEDAYSNWYYSPNFTIDNHTFDYGEKAMMWLKSLLFGDFQKADEIMLAKFPWDTKDKNGKVIEFGHKSLGRQVKGFDEKIWFENCDDIMDAVTYAKFSQIDDLREGIIHSDPLMIVEASPYDLIWGIGLEENDPKAWDVATWPANAQNRLGKSCMRTRAVIIQESK